MKGNYVGHLSRQDPLYGFLAHDILRRIGVYEDDGYSDDDANNDDDGNNNLKK